MIWPNQMWLISTSNILKDAIASVIRVIWITHNYNYTLDRNPCDWIQFNYSPGLLSDSQARDIRVPRLPRQVCGVGIRRSDRNRRNQPSRRNCCVNVQITECLLKDEHASINELKERECPVQFLKQICCWQKSGRQKKCCGQVFSKSPRSVSDCSSSLWVGPDDSDAMLTH